jgi:hypothetical protein
MADQNNLPDDPFDEELPEFPDLTGPARADEIKQLISTYVESTPDFLAYPAELSRARDRNPAVELPLV